MGKKYTFNLNQFSSDNNCNPEKLIHWLNNNKISYPFSKNIILNERSYKKLINCCISGVKNAFNEEGKADKNTTKDELEFEKATVVKIKKAIQGLNSDLEKLKIEEQKHYRLKATESALSKEILEIQNRYKKAKAEDSLKFDSHYQEKIRQRTKSLHDIQLTKLSPEKKLAITEKIKEAYAQVEEVEGKIRLLEKKKKMEKMIKVLEAKAANRENRQKSADIRKKNPLQKDGKTIVNKAELLHDSLITVRTLDWECVNFIDGFIIVKIGNKWFEKYAYKEAKKSLNYIKGLYKFRNAPNLVVEITGSRINRIVNLEVLEYYITFLSFADTFDRELAEGKRFSISKFRKYSKSFYKSFFPKLFLPRNFQYLFENALDDLPIFPIPEQVKRAIYSPTRYCHTRRKFKKYLTI
jgi:hypothetical protein